MSVANLAKAIKSAIDARIAEESKAKRGYIENGFFQSRAKSYPFKSAVDVDTSEGKQVYAQLSSSGKAIIIGS